MPDAQLSALLTKIDDLLGEITETRKSFDAAVSTIRWHKVNTRIMYSLIAVLVLVVGSVVVVYRSNSRAACVRGNDLRAAVVESLDEQATAIGTALAVVSGASPETLEEFLAVYRDQPTPQALQLRDC